MSIFDKLFGHHEEKEPKREGPAPSFTGPAPREPGELSDEQAIERYRYMLRTAPPETIEQAHAEAFAKLTPEQRRMVLEQLSAQVPEQERLRPDMADDPQALARMATRAEMREPGLMERVFGGGAVSGYGGGFGMSGGPGIGSMIAGGILGGLAANIAGSMIARHFFSNTDMGQAFLGGGDYNRPLFAPSGSRDDDVTTSPDDIANTDTEEADTEDMDLDAPETDGADFPDDIGEDGGFGGGGSDDL